MTLRLSANGGDIPKISAALIMAVAASVLVGCASTSTPSPDGSPPPSSATSASASDDEIVQSALDEQWSTLVSVYPNAQRPDVEIERFISLDEWAQTIAQCTTEAGFDGVTADEDGSLTTSEIPTQQAEALEIAIFTCKSKFPLDPKYQRPLEEEQLSLLYDYYTGDLTDCLSDIGYSVSAPPSREVFIESYETSPWLPFSEAMQQGGDISAIEGTCPQFPENLYG